MLKITSKHILGLIVSLTIISESSAKQIHFDFEAQGSFYTSPVVYLTGFDGQKPKLAIKEGIPTTGGVDAKEINLTQFNFVSFQTTPEIAINELIIIPYSIEEDPFCNNLNVSLFENKILLPSTFPKLTTATSCHFKIVSLDNTENEVSDNKITFIFNYTLPGWLADLGKETKAQYTANMIKETDPNSTTISLTHQQLVDISPLMGFIKMQMLDLSGNQIKVIPDAIVNFNYLKYLYFHKNQIKVIPETIGKLRHLQVLYFGENKIELIPEIIGNFSKLKTLNLRNNKISIIPNSIGELARLQELELNNNKIEVLPDSIGKLTNLKILNLHNNKISIIPNSIENLALLQELDLSDNKIEVIPDTIENMSMLNEPCFDNNHII